MKAIILAAGLGTRLGDITKNIPKPMIKLSGKPILEHNIEWLRNYGIKDLYINLHHLPEAIKNYFSDGSKWSVKIKYSFEPEILGTAGAVAKIAHDFFSEDTDPFLVIYGDNLFRYDLQEIIKFHMNRKASATIAVYKKKDVSQSGIVVMDKNCKILRFIEKPQPEETISNLVNTGIYVLEKDTLNYIPFGNRLDFGKQIFPAMIDREEFIYACLMQGGLTAIDTPELLSEELYNIEKT